MTGDLILDDEVVTATGNQFRIEGPDLVIDHAPRRTAKGGSLRRALVHGFSDELVINFGQDYPGGVTIEGDVRIPARLTAEGITMFMNESHGGETRRTAVDVSLLFEQLRDRIESLERRVAALESAVRL
ncbi:MAG TPA: hypothetical protein VKB93_08930 [Thermoanaerobaculia bacterium]|nr:hypothetical protein [Thermoanaerobaculia bacterium]